MCLSYALAMGRSLASEQDPSASNRELVEMTHQTLWRIAGPWRGKYNIMRVSWLRRSSRWMVDVEGDVVVGLSLDLIIVNGRVGLSLPRPRRQRSYCERLASSAALWPEAALSKLGTSSCVAGMPLFFFLPCQRSITIYRLNRKTDDFFNNLTIFFYLFSLPLVMVS